MENRARVDAAATVVLCRRRKLCLFRWSPFLCPAPLSLWLMMDEPAVSFRTQPYGSWSMASRQRRQRRWCVSPIQISDDVRRHPKPSIRSDFVVNWPWFVPSFFFIASANISVTTFFNLRHNSQIKSDWRKFLDFLFVQVQLFQLISGFSFATDEMIDWYEVFSFHRPPLRWNGWTTRGTRGLPQINAGVFVFNRPCRWFPWSWSQQVSRWLPSTVASFGSDWVEVFRFGTANLLSSSSSFQHVTTPGKFLQVHELDLVRSKKHTE